MRALASGVGLATLYLTSLGAWNNGQTGNTATNTAAECSDPPYATHDWIADHAMDLLPDNKKAWLQPHRAIYLIGTEAPDNRTIRPACGVPHRGYDDRSQGHSVRWNASATTMTNDRPAVRAQEEYDKAVIASARTSSLTPPSFSARWRTISVTSPRYGHSWPDETHHSDYQQWAAGLTSSFDAGTFEDAIDGDSLVRRTPYTAARRISRATFTGRPSDDILQAPRMDTLFSTKPQGFIDSVRGSLNLGVNEVADVLHTFFINVVDEADD